LTTFAADISFLCALGIVNFSPRAKKLP
jgi:hypothetical protein